MRRPGFKILITCVLQATLLVSHKAVSDENLIKKMEPKSISKLDLKINKYAQKNDYIRNCLVSVPDDTDEDVSFNANDGKGEWNAAYDLKKENGQLVVESKIYFYIKKSKAEMTQQVEEVIPCMENFFARHGIKFRPNFYYETGLSLELFFSDHKVTLSEDLPGQLPDSRNWPTKMSDGIPISLTNKKGTLNRCTVFLHEYSHLLGMVDSKKECFDDPFEKQKKPLTATSGYAPPEELRICPEQIKTMLRPLCGSEY